MLGIEDSTAEATYAAVGLALSRWEEMEVVLADLYSIFSGVPPRDRVMRDFCDANRIFAARLQATEEAAADYFVRAPDQESEGALKAFAERARRAARNLNIIAHGLVQSVWIAEQDEDGNSAGTQGYLLIAPYFSMRRLRVEPDEGFGSFEIKAMSNVFIELKVQALALLSRLTSPRPLP